MTLGSTTTPPEAEAALLVVDDLKKHYLLGGGPLSRASGKVFAVDGVSFSIADGETLGLVGESGCGKTTVGRSLLKLIEPTSGRIIFAGEDISRLNVRQMRPYRRQMQMIFQDPYSSLDPSMTAGRIVAEPLIVHRAAAANELDELVAALFSKVGLRPEQRHEYPRSFSGGQRQRIGIARALALNPRLIVADEPVSALDVSVQAQVINLMLDLQDELRLAYLFIAHDIAVVSAISHRIGVMYLGRMVEITTTRELIANPLHPYTMALLSAVPQPDPSTRVADAPEIMGDVPSPAHPPSGCHFHTRCPYVMARCHVDSPPLEEVAPGHFVACHLHRAMPQVYAAAEAGDARAAPALAR